MEQLTNAIFQSEITQNSLDIQSEPEPVLLGTPLLQDAIPTPSENKRKRSESPPTTKFTLSTATFGTAQALRPFVALGFQMSIQPMRPKRTGPLSKQLTLLSDDGKFKCPFCQRPFQRRHDAQRHSIIHTRDKPYVCRGCDARFPRADRRANHWKKTPGCWEKHHETPDYTSVPAVMPVPGDPVGGQRGDPRHLIQSAMENQPSVVT